MSDGSIQWIDVFPEPCLLITPAGVIVRANPAFLRLVQADSTSLSGQELQHLSSTDPGKLCDYLKLCSTNRSFVLGSLSLQTKAGVEVFRCEGAAVAVTDSGATTLILLRLKAKQGAVVQFTLLNQKIQELSEEIKQRVATEEALRKSENLFRGLADSMPQIVWAAGPDGVLDYYNRRWHELTGIPEGATGDESWLPVLHPDDRQRCFDLWYESVRTGKPYEIEYRFKFPQQEGYRWHLGRALPVRDAEGKIIRWFGTCTDIDDQKRAEENLERAVEERTASLQAAISQLEEFSYSVSHDLRAPARAMQGYARVLLSDYSEQLRGEGQDYLQRIIRAGERMDKLINDVLTYSLISRAEFQNQPVPLGEVVSEVVEQYPQLQSPHAELEVAPLPSVLGHEPSLTQVISNLLTNAVKFVPDGVKPKVKVWAEVQGTSARIWIEDNGIGIEPEYQNKIFGLFERIHPDQKYPGNGIGLSVVRKALERMGGQVGVVSDGVNGSRFWIQMRAAA